MKQLFHIENGGTGQVQKVLSMRLGEKHAGFSITDKPGNELYELVYCTTEDPVASGWDESSLADLFTAYPSLHHSFYQVLVAYDFPQSILSPMVFYQPEESQVLLNSMYGRLPGSNIISERIAEWQLYNTYAVPGEVQGWVNKKFPASQFWHQYSLAVKGIQAAGKEGTVRLDFRKDDFMILAANNSRLLLARAFPYTSPEDIIYYVLKTCRQFSLLQNDVNLQLSGLIDRQSALYNELCQYFIHVTFREAGWNTGSEYPAHFFTSLNDLAQCAS